MVAEGDPGVPVIWAAAVPDHRNTLAIATIHPEVACNFMDLLPLMTGSVLVWNSSNKLPEACRPALLVSGAPRILEAAVPPMQRSA
jgi:hypothetical protein